MKNFFQRYALKGFFGGTGGDGGSNDQTYILTDEVGNEFAAVMVDEKTTFDATPNDIRLGKVAATDSGVTTGTKDIPAYYTSEGMSVIPVGANVAISSLKNYEYTKLQAIVCGFNTSLQNSVAAQKVAINNAVYEVNSTEAISQVEVNGTNKSIQFGIKNDGDNLLILRYFTYKEEP